MKLSTGGKNSWTDGNFILKLLCCLLGLWLAGLTVSVALNTSELAHRKRVIEEISKSVRELLLDNIELREQLREQEVLMPQENGAVK